MRIHIHILSHAPDAHGAADAEGQRPRGADAEQGPDGQSLGREARGVEARRVGDPEGARGGGAGASRGGKEGV